MGGKSSDMSLQHARQAHGAPHLSYQAPSGLSRKGLQRRGQGTGAHRRTRGVRLSQGRQSVACSRRCAHAPGVVAVIAASLAAAASAPGVRGDPAIRRALVWWPFCGSKFSLLSLKTKKSLGTVPLVRGVVSVATS